ncbi:MAG: hypothetical protein ACKO6K_11540 [Chitinophagaceae bacterium]
MQPSKVWDRPLVVALLYTGIAAIVFGPFLSDVYLSDDFQVIYRVATTNAIFYNGFFRPLSDLTFWITYQLAGFQPLTLYVGGLGIHIGCTYALYAFARQNSRWWGFSQPALPFLCGLLFLVYPFHLEAVLWGVGRGASLATLCALLSLRYADYPFRSLYLNVVWSCFFYFLGLSAYETIFPLPLMILLFKYFKDPRPINWRPWVIGFVLTLLLHVLLRLHWAGSFTGSYGNQVLHVSPKEVFLHGVRILARLFVPPFEQTNYFLLGCFIAGLIGLWILTRYWIDRAALKKSSGLIVLPLMLFLSMGIAVTFSVSTHTSESDRLLYFASVWVCLWITMLIGNFFTSPKVTPWIWLLLIGISLLQGYRGMLNWREASRQTRQLLSQVKQTLRSGKKLLIVNLPGEYKGAYILRNGFTEALQLDNLPDTAVQVISQLNYKDLTPEPLRLHREKDRLVLPPGQWMQQKGEGIFSIYNRDQKEWTWNPVNTELWYWEGKRFISVQAADLLPEQ